MMREKGAYVKNEVFGEMKLSDKSYELLKTIQRSVHCMVEVIET